MPCLAHTQPGTCVYAEALGRHRVLLGALKCKPLLCSTHHLLTGFNKNLDRSTHALSDSWGSTKQTWLEEEKLQLTL